MGWQGTARRASVIAALVASAALLAGCVQGPPTPVPTYTPTNTRTATPTPTPEPVPTLIPAGTAEQNYDYFAHVVGTFYEAQGKADGRKHIDNLVSAGFTKADMEVTDDKTPFGYDADSIVFSVKLGDQCLIGQVFSSDYTTDIASVLGTGKCLVGQTRAIDW